MALISAVLVLMLISGIAMLVVALSDEISYRVLHRFSGLRPRNRMGTQELTDGFYRGQTGCIGAVLVVVSLFTSLLVLFD